MLNCYTDFEKDSQFSVSEWILKSLKLWHNVKYVPILLNEHFKIVKHFQASQSIFISVFQGFQDCFCSSDVPVLGSQATLHLRLN